MSKFIHSLAYADFDNISLDLTSLPTFRQFEYIKSGPILKFAHIIFATVSEKHFSKIDRAYVCCPMLC